MRPPPSSNSLPCYPTTPDGRYFVVRGRLWRSTNPHLPADQKQHLVQDLMTARRAKGEAIRALDPQAREQARQRIDALKQALGERGPAWWTDHAPDYNRHLARNTPYADWFANLPPSQHPA
jgi:hypothetical protein